MAQPRDRSCSGPSLSKKLNKTVVSMMQPYEAVYLKVLA
jgi:hypothetical protein